jgi:hypothetical protein
MPDLPSEDGAVFTFDFPVYVLVRPADMEVKGLPFALQLAPH